MSTCTFCFQDSHDPKPFCIFNPGHGCSYGMHHEFLGEKVVEEKPKQIKKLDNNICIKCDLHIKNPVSKTNQCQHEYPK